MAPLVRVFDMDNDPDPSSETAMMVGQLEAIAQQQGVWNASPDAEVIAYVSSASNPMPTSDLGTLDRHTFATEWRQPGWWFVTWRWGDAAYRSDESPADDLLDRTHEVHARFEEFLVHLLDESDPPSVTQLEIVQARLIENLSALVYDHESELRKLLRFLSHGDDEETDRRFAYLSAQIDAFRIGDKERDPLIKRAWAKAAVLGTTAVLGFIGTGAGAAADRVLDQFDPQVRDRVTVTVDDLAELREICGVDDLDQPMPGVPPASPESLRFARILAGRGPTTSSCGETLQLGPGVLRCD